MSQGRAASFLGVNSPLPHDSVEVIQQAIMSAFCTSGLQSKCQVCKCQSSEECVVSPLSSTVSTQVLRTVERSLLVRGQLTSDFTRGGSQSDVLCLCEECKSTITSLSDLFDQLEELRRKFVDLRKNVARVVVVDKLKICPVMFDKWERKLIKLEEPQWKRYTAVSLKEDAPMEVDVKIEDCDVEVKLEVDEEDESSECEAVFEEMVIEPEKSRRKDPKLSVMRPVVILDESPAKHNLELKPEPRSDEFFDEMEEIIKDSVDSIPHSKRRPQRHRTKAGIKETSQTSEESETDDNSVDNDDFIPSDSDISEPDYEPTEDPLGLSEDFDECPSSSEEGVVIEDKPSFSRLLKPKVKHRVQLRNQKRKRPSSFSCTHCEMTFRDRSLLTSHSLRSHFLGSTELGHLECRYCLKFFPTKTILNRHILSGHPQSTNIRCNLCHLGHKMMNFFKSVDELEEHAKSVEHLKRKEDVIVAYCNVCRMSFGKDTDKLKGHLRSSEHAEELTTVNSMFSDSDPSLLCLPCRTVCTTKQKMVDHWRSAKHRKGVSFRNPLTTTPVTKVTEVTTRETQKCPICLKAISVKTRLKRHIKQMHSVVERTCEYCPLKFYNSKDLKLHRRTHKEKFPTAAICHECGRLFDKVANLNAHVKRNHQGERCQCPTCGNFYATPKALEQHQRYIHDAAKGGTRSHDCYVCGLSFKKVSIMRRHMWEEHHEEYTKDFPYVCLVCFHNFPKPEDLDLHKVVHDANTCSLCGKAFSTSRELGRHHRTTHAGKPRRSFGSVTCDLCGKTMKGEGALKRHKQNHEREESGTPFKCEECGKGFFIEKWLEVHKEKMHSGDRPTSFNCEICGKSVKNQSGLTTHMQRMHPIIS